MAAVVRSFRFRSVDQHRPSALPEPTMAETLNLLNQPDSTSPPAGMATANGLQSTNKNVEAYAQTLVPLLSDPVVQKLFRIFLLLSVKETSENILHSSQKIHRDEVRLILDIFLRILGFREPYHSQPTEVHNRFDAEIGLDGTIDFTFKEFLALLPKVLSVGRSAYSEAVSDVYDEFINQVFMKGYLSKRSNKSTVSNNCKRYWCLALPGRLLYFNNRQSKRPKSQTLLYHSAQIQESPEPTDLAILVKIGTKTIKLMVDSEIDRLQWSWALRLARERSSHCVNYHRELFLQRHNLRCSTDVAEKEPSPTNSAKSSYSNNPDVNTQLRDVQAELHSVKTTLEIREAELMKERQRLERFETERDELTRQLIAEQQATKDEEIVRMLAARMLEDEKQHTEKLEEELQERSEELQNEHSLRETAEKQVAEFKACVKAMELKDPSTIHSIQSCDLISGHTNLSILNNGLSEIHLGVPGDALFCRPEGDSPVEAMPKSILKKCSSSETTSSAESV